VLVPDSLYGMVEVPDWATPLIHTAEVQRLREIRLINTSTSSLPGLSDARRYTHTLGVLGLTSHLGRRRGRDGESSAMKALAISCVLHDIGTPPFGHLFEYLLMATSGWSHEGMLPRIIAGDYRPDGKYHQIYFGTQLRLAEVIGDLGVDPSVVVDFVMGRGSLGPLIAGSLDLDNVDNVFRMAHLLGLSFDAKSAVELAAGLGTTLGGLSIDESAIRHLQLWRSLRRRCYEILAFDESTLKAQAMLTDALSYALTHDILSEEHWFMTDEQILRHLYDRGGEGGYLRQVIQRYSISDYYSTIFLGWFEQPKGSVDLRMPQVRDEMSKALLDATRIPCTPYVFYDIGTFEKSLSYGVRTQDSAPDIVQEGTTSRSTIVGIFTPRRNSSAKSKRAAALQVLAGFGLDPATLRPIPTKRQVYGLAGQEELYR
jgi:HD superfamily phosphohydrolase